MPLTRPKVTLVASLVAGMAVAVQADNPRAGAPADQGTRLVRVPVRCGGQLMIIGTEIAPGDAVPADRRYLATTAYLVVPVSDKERVIPDQVFVLELGTRWRRLREGEISEPGRVRVHRVRKEYRRLDPGDRVEAGQTVAVIDQSLAITDLMIKAAGLEAAGVERRAATAGRAEAERRVEAMEMSGRHPGSIWKNDYEAAKITIRLYVERETAKHASTELTQADLLRSMATLDRHECRAPVSGVIQSVEKKRGDAVKALETVLTIETPRNERPPPEEGPGKSRVVPGTRDGLLALFGRELKDGEAAPPDLVVTRGETAARRYRRLRVGDAVEAGQLLACLDDRLARFEVAAKESWFRASEAEFRVATMTREEAEGRVKSMEKCMEKVPDSVSADDYAEAKRVVPRRAEEENACRAKVVLHRAELEAAKKALATYEIRSPVRGIIRELLKVPGEAVRVGEPVLELTADNR